MEGNHNSTPKDYYKILEVEYDATDEKIRLNYRKLALKWHPDKHKGDSSVTAKFQEINEAYNVLIDPDKRFEYDITGIYEIDKYTLREYLARFKGMILTCNGLGIPHTSIWTQQLRETNEYADDEKGPLYESKSRNFIGIDHFILIEPEFFNYSNLSGKVSSIGSQRTPQPVNIISSWDCLSILERARVPEVTSST
ncbi:hypothetical protein ES319_D08G264100v1 [Gossypium barbadense]|uniref:J domain-containing protein n=2 Tax=Gossypium TaxID=3633 RepID=A0A5J5QQJ2_GOSBA|nr:hypothetical protein ES319_D08G264100v1 [Gossypium barbadense]TYH60184.1 hypothetical protein ES332_D08G275800v1 [Gossypium tomentosum]